MFLYFCKLNSYALDQPFIAQNHPFWDFSVILSNKEFSFRPIGYQIYEDYYISITWLEHHVEQVS